jgi:hypothetical protein
VAAEGENIVTRISGHTIRFNISRATYASLVCVYAPPHWTIIVLLLSPYTFECGCYVFVVLKASEVRYISQNKHVLQVISRTVQQYDEVRGPEQVNSAQYAF